MDSSILAYTSQIILDYIIEHIRNKLLKMYILITLIITVN